MTRRLLLVLVSALVAGCAGTRTRSDAESATVHRADAESARSAVEAHRLLRTRQAAATDAEPGLPVMADQADDGWSSWHLVEAARHRYHAHQHEAAAAALEHAEDVECRGIPARVRAACPVLINVATVVETPRGVRVELSSTANVDQAVALMRCHLAFARVRGFDGVSACPLYVKGVDIRREGRGIEIDGATPAVIGEIRARIHEEKPR